MFALKSYNLSNDCGELIWREFMEETLSRCNSEVWSQLALAQALYPFYFNVQSRFDQLLFKFNSQRL